MLTHSDRLNDAERAERNAFWRSFWSQVFPSNHSLIDAKAGSEIQDVVCFGDLHAAEFARLCGVPLTLAIA